MPLNIPSCGQKCSLEDFRKVYESIIPVNGFEKECQLSMLSMTYEEIDFHGIDGGKDIQYFETIYWPHLHTHTHVNCR